MPFDDSASRRRFLGTLGLGGLLTAWRPRAPTSAQIPAPAAAPAAGWWPSRWGQGDQAGASNWITPDKVLDAAKLIRDGKIYRLGRTYEAGMPLFGTRTFSVTIPGGPTGGPFGSNKLVYHDEFVAGQISRHAVRRLGTYRGPARTRRRPE